MVIICYAIVETVEVYYIATLISITHKEYCIDC